jgi:hypothetical protein
MPDVTHSDGSTLAGHESALMHRCSDDAEIVVVNNVPQNRAKLGHAASGNFLLSSVRNAALPCFIASDIVATGFSACATGLALPAAQISHLHGVSVYSRRLIAT